MEPEGSWLRSPVEIRNVLREIAKDLVALTAALTTSAHFRQHVGNLSIMPKDCFGKTTDELAGMLTAKLETERVRIQSVLTGVEIEQYARRIADGVQKSLERDGHEWKELIPGKQLLSIFAGRAKLDVGRLKVKYIKCAEKLEINPFHEIIDIFHAFERGT